MYRNFNVVAGGADPGSAIIEPEVSIFSYEGWIAATVESCPVLWSPNSMKMKIIRFALLRQKALWLSAFVARATSAEEAATGMNGILGFAGFRKDAPRLAAGCFTLTAVLWIGLLAATRVAADTHYVAQCGQAPSPNYLSWTTAASNIQDAIDVSTASDTVLVSNGVYQTGGLTNYPVAPNKGVTNRVVINKAIIVRSANNDPTNTIIKGAWDPVTTNGDAAVRCVYMTNGASLIGFMLTNGATQTTYGNQYRNGGGVWSESTNTVISNCVITGNACGNNALAGDGAGAYKGTLYNCWLIYNFGSGEAGGASGSTLYNCKIIGNVTQSQAGGVENCTMYNCEIVSNSVRISSYSSGGAYGGMLYNCLIAYNSAPNYGGVCQSILSNCTIANNFTSGGAGGAKNSILYNCTVVSNSAATGAAGGVYDGSNYNCLIAYNSATNSRGGGAERCYLYNCTIVSNLAKEGGGVDSSPQIHNSIIYFNTSTGQGSNWYCNTDPMNFTNSCTFPTPSGTGINWPVGNITNDPQLVNKNTGNFRLSRTSPCINTATNFSWMTDFSDIRSKDLDGYRRLDRFRGLPDMGCYEYVPPGTIYRFH